jgi:hypothetical protein
MIIEGVTFVEPAVKQMKKKEFIDAHKDVFWLDREPKEREKILSDAYDAITKQKVKEE